ncbi:MAG TPA: MmcQ/YjbR family DNA-binding protein [Lacipirellulaceae bacterium]|nr:MmcQ/YjbR family DNA-binding protein [Lacipirellulaceae bacterium]
MARTERTISDAVRDVMASLPETEEFVSHGAPTFRVRGRVFASYTINHHGDGRVALVLMAPRGAQAAFTKLNPDAYFVPPYVGPKGWLGIELDKGLGWETIREHAREAYEMVAPPELANAVENSVRVKPPTRKFRPDEIDPFKSKRAETILKKLEAICSALPETLPATQFGAPVWRAGKKTFVSSHYYTGRFNLSFWVGAKRQAALPKDGRYRISQYTGHNGWIDLDVEEHQDWDEIRELALESYRKFALKRMLKALDGA